MGDNTVIHVEVVGKDGPALQKFYGDVLGWDFDTDNPGGYGMAPASDNGVVTGIGGTQDGGPGHVTFYVAVKDIDQALEKATKLGGRVIQPKFSPGANATIALFADPEGHVVGLSQA